MVDQQSLEPFFNKKVSEADGVKRNLRVQNALNAIEGYQISDQEIDETSYYGYLNADGAWYIMKAIRVGTVTNYTYKAGSSGYSWAGRTSGTYASFDTTF